MVIRRILLGWSGIIVGGVVIIVQTEIAVQNGLRIDLIACRRKINKSPLVPNKPLFPIIN